MLNSFKIYLELSPCYKSFPGNHKGYSYIFGLF